MISLSEDESPAFTALGQLIDTATIKRDGMASTSFDLGLAKFNRSFEPGNDFEHFIDLATSLEAILIGGSKDTDSITLRLRHRASALLATQDDSGESISKDIQVLYGLRSRLVHGGNMTISDVRKSITPT